MVVTHPLAGIRSHIWWSFNVDVVAEVGTRIYFTNLKTAAYQTEQLQATSYIKYTQSFT